MEFDFGAVLVDWRLLAKGIVWTIGLTAIATVVGMVVGVACAWASGTSVAGAEFASCTMPFAEALAVLLA